jgi:hypothetical protein
MQSIYALLVRDIIHCESGICQVPVKPSNFYITEAIYRAGANGGQADGHDLDGREGNARKMLVFSLKNLEHEGCEREKREKRAVADAETSYFFS